MYNAYLQLYTQWTVTIGINEVARDLITLLLLVLVLVVGCVVSVLITHNHLKPTRFRHGPEYYMELIGAPFIPWRDRVDCVVSSRGENRHDTNINQSIVFHYSCIKNFHAGPSCLRKPNLFWTQAVASILDTGSKSLGTSCCFNCRNTSAPVSQSQMDFVDLDLFSL